MMTRRKRTLRADDSTLYYVTMDEQQRLYWVYIQTVDMGRKIGTTHTHTHTQRLKTK